MWSLFLIGGHLYLSGLCKGLESRTDTKKSHVMMRVDCVLKIKTCFILNSIVNTIWRAHVSDCFREREVRRFELQL